MRLIGLVAQVAEAQRGTLVLWAPVALALGIAAYFAAPREPAAWLAIALGAGGLAAILAPLRWPVLRPLILAGLCLAGFAVAKLHTERHAAPVLTEIRYGPVAGRVVGFDRSANNRLRLWLDQVHIPGLAPAATPERVRLVVGGALSPGADTPGARVMAQARLTPPPPPVEPDGFDFRRHAWFLRLGAIGYTTQPVVLEAPVAQAGGTPVLAARMALSRAIQAQMPGRAGGFAAAILTGDRSGIDPQDLVDLRASNLAHLLAISGLHMGLLTGTVFTALRLGLLLIPGLALALPLKKIAAIGALAAGAAYLLLSGASVATQRAFIMALVIFVAVLVDRPALTLRAVAVAAIIVLLWRPVSLVGAGFQMSFAATVGLIAVYDMLKRRRWWLAMGQGPWTFVRAVFAVALTSFVAGAATAPYSAFHFNQVSQLGLVANILAVPAMGLLVMPSALFAFLLWPVGLQGLGFGLMELGIDHILNVAHRVAAVDGAVRPVASGPGWVLGVLSLGVLVCLLARGPLRLAGAPAVLAAGLAWAMAERPDILVSPDGALVGVSTPEGRALSKARGAGFAARVWLENDGDPADQKTAAARAADAGALVVARTDKLQIRWLGGDTAAPGDCTADTLLIAPKLPRRPAGACHFLGAGALAASGAHAFKIGDLDAPRTAAAATGTRPWTAGGHSGL
ncbi:MAG: ComEC/Rec2 family competence protein [Pseudomonadota bacterium]